MRNSRPPDVKKHLKNQRRNPKQQRAREKYLAVMAACTQVLSRYGYRKTTMLELSLTSGVAVPTIYQYFANKEEIVLAWFESIIEQILGNSLTLAGELDDETLESQIAPIIGTVFKQFATYRPTIRRVFDDVPSLMSSRVVGAMQQSTVAFVKSLKTPNALALEQSELDRRIAVLIRCVIGYLISSVFSDDPEQDSVADAEEMSLLIRAYLRECGVLQPAGITPFTPPMNHLWPGAVKPGSLQPRPVTPAPGTVPNMDTVMFPTQQSRLLLSLLEQAGASTTSLMQGTGLQAADLDNGDTLISYRQTMQIVDNAYVLTGHGPLGLEVGAQEDASTFGILGYAMLSCATVGDALEVGEKYQRTAQNLCEVWLEPLGADVSISANLPFVVKPSGYRFAIEELFSGVMAFIRVLSGKDVYPNAIHCVYADPGYRDNYEQVFRCPVYFEQSANRMVLCGDLLNLPVLQANPFNADLAQQLCATMLHKHVGDDELITRIRYIMLRTPGSFPDEVEVATALGLSGRTMRRQLSALGSSYREVLDQLRRNLAQQYLQNSTISIERVGQLLGYSETTNFRRAFKRWVGLSPREYRRKAAANHRLTD